MMVGCVYQQVSSYRVTDCQIRWKHLREEFGKERKKESEKRSGAGADNTRPWYLLEHMRFLEDHVRPPKCITNMVQAWPSGMTTSGLPLATTAPVEVEVKVDCVTTLPEGGEVIFQKPRQGQKRKRNTKTQDDELQLWFLENLEKLHQSLSAEND